MSNESGGGVRRSLVVGVGSALPRRVMTNDDISKIVDTSDEWIVERTGIKSRHIASEGETTRTLGTAAAEQALAHAGMAAQDVDMIIVATSTPDRTFPATATLIQTDLGITHGAAFDVQAKKYAEKMALNLPTPQVNVESPTIRRVSA